MSRREVSAQEVALLGLVGRRLKELRREAGLTQESMAARLDMGLRNYQRFETGQVNISLRTVARFAKTLGVAPWALLMGGP